MDSNQQVEPQEKKKTPKGRAKKRITYTRRFVNVTLTGGKRKVRTPCLHATKIISDLTFADEPQPNHIDNFTLGRRQGDGVALHGQDQPGSDLGLLFSRAERVHALVC
jgi:hypothetical protein